MSKKKPTVQHKPRIRLLPLAVILLLGCLAGLIAWPWLAVDDAERSPRRRNTASSEVDTLRSQLRAGEFQQVYEQCKSLLETNPLDSDLLLLAGESASKLEKFDEAIAFYNQVPDSNPLKAATARWACGEVMWHLGRPTASIHSLQKSVHLNPQLSNAHERLIWLFTSSARRSEIVPHAVALMRDNRSTITLLLDLGNPRTFLPNWNELERFRTASPEDLLPNLAVARGYIAEGKLAEAEELLNALVGQQPELAAAQALLAEVLKQTQPERLSEWQSALPKTAQQDAAVRVVQGEWLEQQERSTLALRAYAEAVKIDPNHPVAHGNLARLLASYKSDQRVIMDALSQRAIRLHQFEQAVDRIRLDPGYEPTIRQTAELAFQLGRIWEAVGWCGYGGQVNPQAAWPRELISRIRASTTLSLDMPHTMPSSHLINDTLSWLEEFPLPEIELSRETTQLAAESEKSISPAMDQISAGAATETIRFEEVTAHANIAFRYNNSQTDRSVGRRMFQVTGGGVGTIDFDMDGLEDIFLTQGTAWPPPTMAELDSDSDSGDVLQRNNGLDASGVVRFTNHSKAARIQETGFGQGLSIADFNNDGFDDIYVANFLANQLWINQGDGTFVDANHWFNETLNLWTASTVAMDVDGDGTLDLIDINYALGDEVTTLRCQIDGLPRACPPLVFSRAPLVIWLADGEETFTRYVSTTTTDLNYYGLGGVGFLSQADTTPTLFVAVDQQANGLLRFENVTPGETATQGGTAVQGTLAIEDMALLAGIAFNERGEAEACMGIAAGDATGDGELDLFVTNFYEETNTLYVQEGGAFADRTTTAGLAIPSRNKLGFGTQMIDANLRGTLDIVALNGHIDDLTHTGVPEKMNAQFFFNRGSGRFAELPGESVGPYFTQLRLGRSLAIADVDNNGLIDLLCSDLEEPFALLLNRSTPRGNYLALRLIGVHANRNGLLSTVTVTADGFTARQQLLAGGGYMAANTRTLIFAVPPELLAETLKVTVRWQSGQEEVFTNLSLNQQHNLVEGQSKL